MVAGGDSQIELTAQQAWARGLQTYRAAVETYRRFLAAKAVRPARGTPLPEQVVPRLRLLPKIGDGCTLSELTPRERELADLVSRGYTNQQIADRLVLTRGTVANHVAHVLGKIGATNRTQIAHWMHLQTTEPTSNTHEPATLAAHHA